MTSHIWTVAELIERAIPRNDSIAAQQNATYTQAGSSTSRLCLPIRQAIASISSEVAGGSWQNLWLSSAQHISLHQLTIIERPGARELLFRSPGQNPDSFVFRFAEQVMKLRPLGDRIIVRRTEASEKSSGGIILPDNAKQKPQKGTVLATGPGKMLKDGTRRPLQVKEGNTILFTAWAGDEFKDRGTKDAILVMHEEDVLAVVG